MKNKIGVLQIAKEICEREQNKGRDLNIAQVKTVVRHLCDMIAEEWVENYDLEIAAALRRNGLGRIKKKRPR